MDGDFRQLPQLTDRLEWNLVARQEFIGREVIVGRRRRVTYDIPDQRYVIDGHVILVGLSNPFAQSNWYLGAWGTQALLFNPSSTSQFFSAGVQAQVKRLRVNALTLWVTPKLDRPWRLELRFPYWHSQMLVEIWRYDGLDFDLFERLRDLETGFGQIADSFDGGI